MKTTIMKNKVRMAVVMAVIVLSCIGVRAADADTTSVARPVLSMFTFDVGRASVLDTYISTVNYTGLNLRLGYSAMQATGFSPEKWVRHLELGVEYYNVKNMVRNRVLHTLMLDSRWSLMRRWRDVLPGLQLMGGGMAQLRGGVIYKGSNSNNVCSVKAHISLGVAGTASYACHIGRLPITLSYQMSLPVVGVFYSPDYDESYYEIYVGNRKGLVHPGWWGNRFDMNNLVAADLHLGNTILRLGYRNRIERSWVNNLNTHITTHAFVIGLGGNFLSLGSKPTPRKLITAF